MRFFDAPAAGAGRMGVFACRRAPLFPRAFIPQDVPERTERHKRSRRRSRVLARRLRLAEAISCGTGQHAVGMVDVNVNLVATLGAFARTYARYQFRRRPRRSELNHLTQGWLVPYPFLFRPRSPSSLPSARTLSALKRINPSASACRQPPPPPKLPIATPTRALAGFAPA